MHSPVCCADTLPIPSNTFSRARKSGVRRMIRRPVGPRDDFGMPGLCMETSVAFDLDLLSRPAGHRSDHSPTPPGGPLCGHICLLRVAPALYCLPVMAVSTTPRPHRVPTRFLRSEEAINSCTVVGWCCTSRPAPTHALGAPVAVRYWELTSTGDLRLGVYLKIVSHEERMETNGEPPRPFLLLSSLLSVVPFCR